MADYIDGAVWGYQDANKVKNHASGATAPATPTEGEAWYDTTNSVLKIYDGSAWRAANCKYADAEPTSPVAGDLWYDSVNLTLKIYSGAAWVVCLPATAAVAQPVQMWMFQSSKGTRTGNNGGTTYTYLIPDQHTFWAEMTAATCDAYFEVTLQKLGTGSGVAYARLFDNTASAAVANSEVTHNTATYFVKRSEIVILVKDHLYSLQIKIDAATAEIVNAVGARIIFA